MSISLRNIRGRFRNTGGTDPLFAPVDGANCPDAVPASFTSGAPYGSLKGKGLRSLRQAYSLLLNRGLIRIRCPGRLRAIPIPNSLWTSFAMRLAAIAATILV